MPGLGASFGRGAATGNQRELARADCVLIMGSNMAEAHPVGFRFPMKAKEKGAKLIHVDPRFSRTSALCDQYVGIRAGSDIAFLGGLINYVIQHEKWFKEFVLHYTNASTIISEAFKGTEELGGIFSGYDNAKRDYSAGGGQWVYEGSTADQKYENHQGIDEPEGPSPGGMGPAGVRHQEASSSEEGVGGTSLMGGYGTHLSPRKGPTEVEGGIHRDPTLQHPRCAFQLLKKHFARYTPEMVSKICGCSVEEFTQVAETLCENSGREKTSSIVYAVGWTQHSNGPQIIRAAGILQQLLGNVGRPGGMVMAMRGHCSIQGSTDIPTLYDLLPGYLPQPTVEDHHLNTDDYANYEGLPTGVWANTHAYAVSLLKAYYGEAATAENDWRFKWLPRVDADYSQLAFFRRMARGEARGYFVLGQNPAGGGPNAGLHRKGLRELDWLVVADWFETETATFWKHDPKGPPPSDIKTETFFIPAAVIAEKEGTFTNTDRLLQGHDKAIDPPDDCRSDLWFVYHLGKRLKALYAGSEKPQDQAIQALTWDYEEEEPTILGSGRPSRIHDEPDAEKVLQEINGYFLDQRDEKTGKPKLLADFGDCRDDGTTACGGWIYSGVFPAYGQNLARNRQRHNDVAEAGWGFAWPKNSRVMYNRASADPQGRPWSEKKKLIWWDAQQGKWVGDDIPDFVPDKAPDYRPPEGARGLEAIAGDEPFILHPDGQAWLFAPAMEDGPFPAHYEAVESPVRNALYPRQNTSPTVRYFEGPLNILDHTPSQQHRIVATTFRLTEHYLSGPMSRFNSWLNELQPEMFVELSPELAAEKGITHGGWLTVRSARGSIEARAMVTRRLKPLEIDGQVIHQVGIPFHWGYAGETVGDIANDLTSITAEPNVSIQESKTFAVQVEAGRTGSSNQTPTVPYSPWPQRKDAPQTPPSAQPEGYFKP